MKKSRLLLLFLSFILCLSGSCGLFFDTSGDASGNLVILLGDPGARGVGTAPGDGNLPPFSEITVTAAKGNQILSTHTFSGKSTVLNFQAPVGSGYTVEVTAQVDFSSNPPVDFAKSYGGRAYNVTIGDSVQTVLPITLCIKDTIILLPEHDGSTATVKGFMDFTNFLPFDDAITAPTLYEVASLTFDSYGRLYLLYRLGSRVSIYDDFAPSPTYHWSLSKLDSSPIAPNHIVFDPRNRGLYLVEGTADIYYAKVNIENRFRPVSLPPGNRIGNVNMPLTVDQDGNCFMILTDLDLSDFRFVKMKKDSADDDFEIIASRSYPTVDFPTSVVDSLIADNYLLLFHNFYDIGYEGRIMAVDTQTLEILWNAPTGAEFPDRFVGRQKGKVYLVGGPAGTKRLFELDLKSGKITGQKVL